MHFLDIREIETFFLKAEKFTSLQPWKEVNSFFCELCSFCVKHEKKIPRIKEVEVLQKMCSTWECLLEKFISQSIIDSENPLETLRWFEYYKNYEDLSWLEYMNLAFYWDVKSILFLGVGALPLTAIILAKKYDIQCRIVDYDIETVDLGKKLIEKLWLEDSIEYIFWDAYNYNDSKKYDVCYVAALIWWEEQEQIKLLDHIRLRINTNYFLLRSSHGTRELLYRKVSLSLLRKYLDIEHIIHPKNRIINSIIIAKKYE